MHRPLVYFFLLCQPLFLFCQNNLTMEKLSQQISDSFALQKGVFAVAFRDLSTGKTIFINEHESFHAASTMKTPVMIEIYKKAARKKISLSDEIVIRNEFKSIVDGSSFSLDSADDSDKEIYKHIGEKRSISSLVYDMIIVSSNLATNMVIELADAKKITQTMRRFGAKDIQVRRGVEDQKAYDAGLNNTTTAFDLLLIFEKIATGKAVNKKADDDMIKILLDQRFNEIIPAKLPSTVKVAHKTGSITGVQHDSGIVFLPDGRKYVLVLLSKQLENPAAAIQAMATVSEMIYNFVK